MRLVILGGPGAGKGTQAERLCSHLSILGISTGEILRQAIASQTQMGIQGQPYVETGELVPDSTMIEFIHERLIESDAIGGWLLDGYPRTAFQAEELDFLLDDLGQHLDWAIWLRLSESTMVSRSVARARPDDQPEIVQRRIAIFNERTIPLLEYYEHRHRLLTIDGHQSPEQVQQEILTEIAKKVAP